LDEVSLMEKDWRELGMVGDDVEWERREDWEVVETEGDDTTISVYFDTMFE
jgi:hypothetical protein